MKKILIILLLFLLTGCTKYNDLNDLAIIKSIGISFDNEYTLYAEIIDDIDKDNIPKTKIINTKNKEIEKTFDNIKLLVNKEIYLSHIDLIILDPNLKDDNYQEIINYFLKNKEFRNDFLVVFSNEIENVLKNSKYDEIEELIKTNKESKDVINITFEQVIKDYLDKQKFKASLINYKNQITFIDNLEYFHNQIERINNEKQNWT